MVSDFVYGFSECITCDPMQQKEPTFTKQVFVWRGIETSNTRMLWRSDPFFLKFYGIGGGCILHRFTVWYFL